MKPGDYIGFDSLQYGKGKAQIRSLLKKDGKTQYIVEKVCGRNDITRLADRIILIEEDEIINSKEIITGDNIIRR
jgi:hypothetical protein